MKRHHPHSNQPCLATMVASVKGHLVLHENMRPNFPFFKKALLHYV